MKTEQATLTRTQKIENLWSDAHTLRGDSRITFGAAIKKYGQTIVRLAMDRGKVAASWTVMITPAEANDVNASGSAKRPYRKTSFEFSEATPEMKMQANGEQVG